jgi:hypothetical protein
VRKLSQKSPKPTRRTLATPPQVFVSYAWGRSAPPSTRDSALWDNAAYAEYWETEFKAMEQHLMRLGEERTSGFLQGMKRRHNEVGDMLAYVNDVLVPHGFDEILKDDLLPCARCYNVN